MSRLRKETRIEIYKIGLEKLNGIKANGKSTDDGLCFVLKDAIRIAYMEELGTEERWLDRVYRDFPELTAEATLKVWRDRYWWNSMDERIIALQNAIKKLE